MNFASIKKELVSVQKFISWDDTSATMPVVFQILGEPTKTEFRGKPKYEIPVMVDGLQKILTCSNNAIGALVQASERFGVADRIDTVTWSGYKTGEKYDTKYHFEIVGKAKAQAPVFRKGVADDDLAF